MPGASQRFGIEHMDLDLELRLRRIEQALEQKLDANPRADVWGAINLPIPRVTGLALGEVVNGWAVEWTPLDIPDLRKYEIRVSTDLNFSTFTEYQTRTNRLTFTDEDSPDAKYIKVRASSLSKRRSIWSSILDTSTGGLVNTSDIEVGAISQFIEFSQETGFSHIFSGSAGVIAPGGDPVPNATHETYGPITISASSGSTVVPFVYCNVEYMSIWQRNQSGGYMPGYGYWYWYDLNDPANAGELNEWHGPENKAVISILRRPVGGADVVVEQVELDWYFTMPSTIGEHADVSAYWKAWIRGVNTLTGSINIPFLPERPGVGTWEYRVKLEVVTSEPDPWNTSFLYFFPLILKMRLFEYKA
jgi:hypothetical protein